jgi:hypothetical protein
VRHPRPARLRDRQPPQGETTLAMDLATSAGLATLVLADRNMLDIPL